MAFTRNSGYAVGTGDPNVDVTIKDGGGNIPTLYIDLTPDPHVIYKFDDAQVSGSKWIAMKAAPEIYGILTDVANNVGASCAVIATWYELSLSSAVTKNHALTSEDSDILTFDALNDHVCDVVLSGQLNTSSLTTDTGDISIRAVLNETALDYTEYIVSDDSSGVLQINMHFKLNMSSGDDLKFEISSSAGTGNVAFDHVQIALSN